jgi:hypothetical protein
MPVRDSGPLDFLRRPQIQSLIPKILNRHCDAILRTLAASSVLLPKPDAGALARGPDEFYAGFLENPFELEE